MVAWWELQDEAVDEAGGSFADEALANRRANGSAPGLEVVSVMVGGMHGRWLQEIADRMRVDPSVALGNAIELLHKKLELESKDA